MFAFDIRDAKLRDPLVNKLVAYWRSGAHLKYDDAASAGLENQLAGDAAPPETPVVGKL